jgi:CheY-like chemotaxis protein
MVDIVSWLTDFGMETSQQLPSNIKLVTNIEKTDAHCKIDPEQLQQIIQHLVTNAQEAMPAGGKLTIHSSTLNLTTPELAPHVKMRNGLWFIIQVSDTGVGISDNIIPHLYEPFFSTKENRLGLGLAHVYSVVKQYNGHISLNSQSGKGTSVTLYLPCQQQTTDSQVAQKLSFQRGNGQTLLLVEDEPIVLKVTTAMLTRLGYQVMSASSGQAALHLHEQYQDQIDVVLIDLTMPDFEGLSLVAALVAQNPTVKVIALTSRVPDSEAQILAAPGIVSWVQKPLDMAQLGQLVSTWVS